MNSQGREARLKTAQVASQGRQVESPGAHGVFQYREIGGRGGEGMVRRSETRRWCPEMERRCRQVGTMRKKLRWDTTETGRPQRKPLLTPLNSTLYLAGRSCIGQSLSLCAFPVSAVHSSPVLLHGSGPESLRIPLEWTDTPTAWLPCKPSKPGIAFG